MSTVDSIDQPVRVLPATDPDAEAISVVDGGSSGWDRELTAVRRLTQRRYVGRWMIVAAGSMAGRGTALVITI